MRGPTGPGCRSATQRASRLFARDYLLWAWAAEEVGDICKVGVQVADVEEGLRGTLGRADDLEADTFLALEVLDGFDVVAVAGDEDVDVGVVGEAHHVHD